MRRRAAPRRRHRGAAPALDLAPRVFHGAPRELRSAPVARRLDRGRRAARRAGARPRSSSPSRTLRRSARRRRRSRRRRASIHVTLHRRGGSRRRPSDVEQLEQHLFVAERARGALHVAQRALAPRRRGSRRTRAGPTSSTVRVRRSATRKSCTASSSAAREHARDRLAEPRVERAELRDEELRRPSPVADASAGPSLIGRTRTRLAVVTGLNPSVLASVRRTARRAASRDPRRPRGPPPAPSRAARRAPRAPRCGPTPAGRASAPRRSRRAWRRRSRPRAGPAASTGTATCTAPCAASADALGDDLAAGARARQDVHAARLHAPRLAQPAPRRASATSPFSSTHHARARRARARARRGARGGAASRAPGTNARGLHELDHAPLLLRGARARSRAPRGSTTTFAARRRGASRSFITRTTSGSLPGMTRLDMHDHVALGSRSSAGCSPRASRARAAALSPCDARRDGEDRAPRAAPARAPAGQTQVARPLEVRRPACSPVERAVALRDPRVRRHAAPEGDDLAPVPARDLAEHPQAMHVRREHRDDDRLRRAGDDAPRARSPTPSSLPVWPVGVDVRRVAEQESHPLAPSSSKRGDVERLAVGRGVVELEIARVDDQARVGPDRERRRVGDRVRDADGLDLEGADPLGARAASRQRSVDVLEHLVLRERARERGRARRRGPQTGTSKRRRKYGIAPMWSSWPCVTKRPAMRYVARAPRNPGGRRRRRGRGRRR